MKLANAAITKAYTVFLAFIIIVASFLSLYYLTLPKQDAVVTSLTYNKSTSNPELNSSFSSTIIPNITPTPTGFTGLNSSFSAVYPTLTPPPSPTPVAFTGLNSSFSAVYPTLTPTPSPTPSPPSPTLDKISLSNAIASGYVQASITGNGGCAGDCILLHIKRLVNYTVEIAPPATGTLLVSSGNAQNMVILKLDGIDLGSSYTPTSIILLNRTDEVTYLFNAYCLNFYKSNPEEYNLFSVSGTANSDVTKILNTVSSLSPTVATTIAIQTAIWTVTDNISLSQLTNAFSNDFSQVGNAKTILIAAGVDTSNKQLFA